MSDKHPSEGAFDGSLEVPGQAAATAEPGEGTFEHPAAWKKVEALGLVRSLDDLQGPITHGPQNGVEFVAGLGAIGADVAKPRVKRTDGGKHEWGAVAVLHLGAMHDDSEQMALRVGDDVALAHLDWGPETLSAEQARDLLEIIEDRMDTGSILVTSQVPVDRWHDMIGVPTIADAILDRLVHDHYRIELKGESLRKQRKPNLT